MSNDRINLTNRAVTYRKRDRFGRQVKVVLTPEGKVSKHEKLIVTMLRSGRKLEHWHQEITDGERMRTSKARGSILAIYRMTGEEPPDIMRRLGLTDEEIGRIHPFTRTVIWS